MCTPGGKAQSPNDGPQDWLQPSLASFPGRDPVDLHLFDSSISMYLCPLPVCKYGSRGGNGLSHSFINIYGLASCRSRSCSGPVCLLLFYFVLFFLYGGAGVIKELFRLRIRVESSHLKTEE